MDFKQYVTEKLKDLWLHRKGVKIITIYKSIPMIFEAKIKDVKNDIASFEANKYQMALSIVVKTHFIQFEEDQNCVWARVASMDMKKGILGLSEFKDAGNSLNRRVYLRVEPDTSIPVFLQIYQTRIMAELADISEKGISVYLDPIYLNTPDFEAGKLSSQFKISFHLPGEEYHPIELYSAIRYGLKDTLSGKYRIGLEMFPGEEAKRLFVQYVEKRKTATMQEIKELYKRSVASIKL